MKKLLIIWLFIYWIINTTSAANFYISPEYSSFTGKCDSSIDIMIDGEWDEIAAADMILLFNTWEVTPLCFIPWDFLNIWWWMEINWNKIKVTSYKYPWYAKWKWKFWTLIFRPFSTTKETTIYFDVRKLWINATAWDSNISRPWWWDILNKAWFAKYIFEDWVCPERDESIYKNCKIYDNSGSFDNFISNYKEEVKSYNTNYTKIIIRIILLLAIFVAILRKFSNKTEKVIWKK